MSQTEAAGDSSARSGHKVKTRGTVMLTLHADLWVSIFKRLGTKDIAGTCMRVCRDWRDYGYQATEGILENYVSHHNQFHVSRPNILPPM